MKKQTQIKAREIKKETVKELAEKITRAKTIIFCDYHGLTVNQINALRKKVKEAGGEIIITKNTLLFRALSINHLPASPTKRGEPLTINQLAGPTATIFAYDDEIAPIKTVADSAHEKGLPKFKFGFFGKDLLDGQAIVELSQIPGRDVLYAKIVGTLASPIYNFVYVLQLNIRNLLSVLDQAAKSASSKASV